MANFDKLHEIQRQHHNDDVNDSSRAGIQESWLDESTVDFWRHRRMYSTVKALTHDKDAQWLTVGDGRLGLDSFRLKKIFNLKNVLPTDISDDSLKKGKSLGFVQEYRVENMEALKLPDKSYDYVFCKEAFHHCPRAWLAFYELCRVARKAVVLIEPAFNIHFLASPTDKVATMRERLSFLKSGKRFTPPSEVQFDSAEYEDCGNFVYRLSKNELEQAVRGLSLPVFAWKGLADIYVPGVEFSKADDSNPAFQSYRSEVERIQDLHDQAPERQPVAIGCGIVFIEEPSKEVIAELKAEKFQISSSCLNPHLK
ncbi:class I SAM-dependent methyltransferase [bacterium]|nr:class I SAM-dependent methyltransferase [bacterium]